MCKLGGDAAIEGTLLLCVLLVGHLEDLDAHDDALDSIDHSDDATGNNTEDDALDTLLGITLQEARNAISVQQDAQDSKSSSIIHCFSSFPLFYIVYSYERQMSSVCGVF